MSEQDDQSVQEDLFQEYRPPEDIKPVQPSVGPAVRNPVQEHVRQFLGLLAASPDDTYAYALAVLCIGDINGLSRVDILADCAARTCRPVEVSIY